MSLRRSNGFTLIELMVTMAVLAVLVAVGFPNFLSVIRSNRVVAANNEALGLLSLARNHANIRLLKGEDPAIAVAKLIEAEGSDAWFTRTPAEILPAGYVHPVTGETVRMTRVPPPKAAKPR